MSAAIFCGNIHELSMFWHHWCSINGQ